MGLIIGDIFQWFKDDPIRVLTVAGGSGGLIYWYDRFRNRCRLRVRDIRESGDSVSFEVENLGGGPTSLQPTVLKRAMGLSGERGTASYTIQENQDRNLPPRTPKRFDAKAISGSVPCDFMKEWCFGTGTLLPKRVFIYMTDEVSPIRFHFVWFKHLIWSKKLEAKHKK